MYLQEPYVLEEGAFTPNMFTYYEKHEIFDPKGYLRIPLEVVVAVDPAISTKQTADYSAIVVV